MILINASDETENFLKEAKKQTLDVHIVNGKMVNISAGGYAFKCMGMDIESMIGEPIELIIHDFALMDGKPLPGVIIRSTDNQDVSIVGCRMMDLVIR